MRYFVQITDIIFHFVPATILNILLILHSFLRMVHYQYTNLNVLVAHSVTGMVQYHYTNLNVLMLQEWCTITTLT